MNDTRPDPDRLLAQASAGDRATDGRGRLKIFLGYAPGVGKTYTMLEAAQARQRAGDDVLIGVVLTHGRAETAERMAGLALLPPLMLMHGGTSIEEFDLAAALARKPTLVVVDELAHTNAPGARHARRWQDVDDLLAAGIDVATTLNVQHVESVHDVVQRLTGVDVRERVPDHVLDGADEIELVDLPPAELRERLRAGKVYRGDAAERALGGFFVAGNLAGLRELALRLVADRVGGAVGRITDAGKLLVCIGPSPFSARLLRATRRMAARLHVGWVALHVQTPAYAALDAAGRERIARHLRLAERLGAEVHTVAGDALAPTIVTAARRLGVARIIVGKPVAPRWRDLLFGSLVFDLVRASGDIDVYVINGAGEADADPERIVSARQRTDIAGVAIAIAAVIAATAVCWLLHGWLDPANLAMIYLLAVIAVAFRGQRVAAVVASVLGVIAFDFLFVVPVFSFTVADGQYLLTFIGMLFVGLAISTLSARLRAQAEAAVAQAASAQALHRVGADLATTRGTAALVAIATARCRELLGVPVVILPTDQSGADSIAAAAAELVHGDHPDLPPGELAVAQWVVTHGEPAGAGTETLPRAAGLHVPLCGSGGIIGVLCCIGGGTADPERLRLIESLAALIGLAIECDRLAQAAQDARLIADAERLRSTLLSSVSHDLRTPLAAIVGSASTLLDTSALPRERQRALVEGIAAEADRLGRLVANLLEATRLSSGAVRLNRVALVVEDLVGTAVAAVRDQLATHPLEIILPADLPAISGDEVLLQSALVNLLDNAAKHTAPDTPITISAIVHDDRLQLSIADRGAGLAAGDEQRIFGRFQRGRTTETRGVGLGLAIVQGVAEAHGGTITAANRAGGGAVFTLDLPLTGAVRHG